MGTAPPRGPCGQSTCEAQAVPGSDPAELGGPGSASHSRGAPRSRPAPGAVLALPSLLAAGRPLPSVLETCRVPRCEVDASRGPSGGPKDPCSPRGVAGKASQSWGPGPLPEPPLGASCSAASTDRMGMSTPAQEWPCGTQDPSPLPASLSRLLPRGRVAFCPGAPGDPSRPCTRPWDVVWAPLPGGIKARCLSLLPPPFPSLSLSVHLSCSLCPSLWAADGLCSLLSSPPCPHPGHPQGRVAALPPGLLLSLAGRQARLGLALRAGRGWGGRGGQGPREAGPRSPGTRGCRSRNRCPKASAAFCVLRMQP